MERRVRIDFSFHIIRIKRVGMHSLFEIQYIKGLILLFQRRKMGRRKDQNAKFILNLSCHLPNQESIEKRVGMFFLFGFQ